MAMAAASDRGGGEVKNIHSKESTKTLLKSEALYEVRSHLTCYGRSIMDVVVAADEMSLSSSTC